MMATASDHEQGERPTEQQRARLTIEMSPALRRRIEQVAARQEIPVQAYVERLLEASVPDDIEHIGRPVTQAYVDGLRQFREEWTLNHPDTILPDSTEEIRRMRQERTDYLESLLDQR